MNPLLRAAKARFIRFRPGDPAVLIFGLRRGGTTMIADAISANQGVWYADEPYAMFPKRPGFADKSRRLFVPKHSHFFGLDGEQADRFADFSHDLLSAKFHAMGTARRTLPGLGADRVCLKVLNAPWMLEWFQANTEAHILSVIRHPGAQGRSVMRLGWGYPVEAYLERPDFLAAVYTKTQLQFAHDIMASGDAWRMAILDWVVTSHPLRMAKGSNVICTTYEDIVARPEGFVDGALVARCGLNEREIMMRAITQPSGSSHLNTAAATDSIQTRDLDKMLNGWRAHTSPQELDAGQEILDAFDITEYRFKDA